jgi:hypothetical protein
MKMPRPRLSYANVTATLALILALGGGAAYAASKIHAGDIASGAVSTRALHKRAVKSGKLAIGAVRTNQVADGSITPAKLQVPLAFTATPTGGALTVPTSGQTPYPLSNSTWTQVPGEVEVIFGAATATLAYDGSGSGACRVFLGIGLRGEEAGPESGGEITTSSTTLEHVDANLGAIPFSDPLVATARKLTSAVQTNGDCTEDSMLDSSRLRVVAFG